jgi:hypothetical protein
VKQSENYFVRSSEVVRSGRPFGLALFLDGDADDQNLLQSGSLLDDWASAQFASVWIASKPPAKKPGSSFGRFIEVESEKQLRESFQAGDLVVVPAIAMYNYSLLKELAKLSTTVLICRHPGAPAREWALAGEYVRAGGQAEVIYCETGLRSIENLQPLLDFRVFRSRQKASDPPIFAGPAPFSPFDFGGSGQLKDDSRAAEESFRSQAQGAVAAGANGLFVRLGPGGASVSAQWFENFLRHELRPYLESGEPTQYVEGDLDSPTQYVEGELSSPTQYKESYARLHRSI